MPQKARPERTRRKARSKRATGWLYTCRAGFEGDLVEELNRRGRDLEPWIDAPALVGTTRRPPSWPTFARAGFPVAAVLEADGLEIAGELAHAIDLVRRGQQRPWMLQVWGPDSDDAKPMISLSRELEGEIVSALEQARPDLASSRVVEAADSIKYGGLLAQVCVASRERAMTGVLPASEVPTLAPGGRARERMPKGSPSRAARKLVEAFEWTGRGPEAGERVVDLGAAPGGWVAVLLERRAKVTSVDPGDLAPHLAENPNVSHFKMSAFEFEPDEPVDWLCCDMAWRPLEVAQLLAKWGRRRWASALVANLKLPMKQRAEFVERLTDIVAEGGWRDIRTRHLYHDRDEFTLAAWRV